MKKQAVRISDDLKGVLKRRASQRGVAFSTYLRQLIQKGLQQEVAETKVAEPFVTPSMTVSLLNCFFEILILLRYSTSLQHKHVLPDAAEQAKRLAEEMLNKKENQDAI